MKLLNVDTIEGAREKLLAYTRDWRLKTLTLDALAAGGHILARDIIVDRDIPAFRRSMVDGYALVAADTAAAGEAIPVFLNIAGRVEMGKPADFSIGRGECAYVPTGGMIPGGADAVVMIEYAESAGKDRVAVYEASAAGSHIAEAGEDMRRGETLLRRGARIRPQETGALAAAGIREVQVYAPLRLALFSAGNELVPPARDGAKEGDIPPGKVRDINSWTLRELAIQSGFELAGQELLPDDEALLEAALKKALAAADVIVLSGGSSQGEQDLTLRVFSNIARPGIFVQGLAMKPGKPAILAYNAETETILAGLPGHPVSAMMVFESLISWFVRALTFQKDPFPVPARISRDLAASPGRALYQPVVLRLEGSSYTAEPVFGKSGMISTLTRADAYIIIDKNKEGLKKNEEVMAFLF
jgi:molybdopterin molybdotransferase